MMFTNLTSSLVLLTETQTGASRLSRAGQMSALPEKGETVTVWQSSRGRLSLYPPSGAQNNQPI